MRRLDEAVVGGQHQRLLGVDDLLHLALLAHRLLGRAAIEQRTCIAAGAKCGVDDDVTFFWIKCCNHFIQQNWDMGGLDGGFFSAAHLPFPLDAASATRFAQAACALSHSLPICASSSGFQMVKKRPAP